ncbi:PadR family transcriptional regulator [Methanosarcina sp.]|uniref:PadR family transcriptional regulator n=1 Tax=Methanosarcina sp. TaxID=2213 RepID=UPI002ABA7C2D|nr:PadR family transcriptional regulator [Methanosarcina sp.]MDY9926965.1 PadR family transcriptional regulator [Methanosarcina sp.]
MHPRQEPLAGYSNSEIQKESDIENVVKKHLDMIVLSIIRTQPMCGQDIVKEVFRQYQVFINQSSVYKVLYSLKERNILEASTTKCDMRSKVYIPTEQGSEMINSMLNEFVSSIEHLLMGLKEETSSERKQ